MKVSGFHLTFVIVKRVLFTIILRIRNLCKPANQECLKNEWKPRDEKNLKILSVYFSAYLPGTLKCI